MASAPPGPSASGSPTFGVGLTSFNEKEYVTGAIEAGAIGYLLKDIEAASLAAAIRPPAPAANLSPRRHAS